MILQLKFIPNNAKFIGLNFATLAQLVEQLFCKQQVVSSSLTGGSKKTHTQCEFFPVRGKGSGNGSFPWRKDWENRGFPRRQGGSRNKKHPKFGVFFI